MNKNILSFSSIKKLSFEEKLAQISYMCRNLYHKTFRIVYVDNTDTIDYRIIGYEYINFSQLNKRFSKENYNNWIKKISYKMYMLNASGYYIIANQKLKKIKISILEKQLVKKISKSLYGFKGYFSIDSKTYSSLLINEKRIKIEKNKTIDEYLGINSKKEISKNPFIKIVIKCELDLIKLMREIAISPQFSMLICLDNNNCIEFIQDVHRELLNLSNNTVKTYIENAIQKSGSKKAYIMTMDKSIFEKMEELEIMKDYKLNCIAYTIIDEKVNILDSSEKEDLKKFYADYEKDLIFKENEEKEF